MRHSRAATFDAALMAAPADPSEPRRWASVVADPNDAAALIRRADTLRRAWRPSVDDRAEFLVRRVKGKKVLDVGCVAHDTMRMAAPEWLHRRLAESSARCMGIDVLEAGIEQMRTMGFDARVCNLEDDIEALADSGPFDVIVAGELIEHVESLQMVFVAAERLLAADGQLILTTPNPYSPARVRAGQRGVVWENVDHIMYAFPSGIAELSERHGLVLAEATTVMERRQANAVSVLARFKRMVLGSGWRDMGYASVGRRKAVGVSSFLTRARARSRRRFVGETFVYVVTRPTGRGG